MQGKWEEVRTTQNSARDSDRVVIVVSTITYTDRSCQPSRKITHVSLSSSVAFISKFSEFCLWFLYLLWFEMLVIETIFVWHKGNLKNFHPKKLHFCQTWQLKFGLWRSMCIWMVMSNLQDVCPVECLYLIKFQCHWSL